MFYGEIRKLSEQQCQKTYHQTWVPSKDLDWPAYPYSLIRIFPGCILDSPESSAKFFHADSKDLSECGCTVQFESLMGAWSMFFLLACAYLLIRIFFQPKNVDWVFAGCNELDFLLTCAYLQIRIFFNQKMLIFFLFLHKKVLWLLIRKASARSI